MKIKWFVCTLLLMCVAFAQNPNSIYLYRFGQPTGGVNTTGSTAFVKTAGLASSYANLAWAPVGTLSACTIQVDYSVDGSTVAGQLITSQTCTGAGSVIAASLSTPIYVRVSYTITSGGGYLNFTSQGCVNSTCSGVGNGAIASTGLFQLYDSPELRTSRGIMSTASATGAAGFNDQAILLDATVADVAATATEPDALGISTSAVSANVAGMDGGAVNRPGRNLWFEGYDSISTTSTILFFVGFSGTSTATQGASDCPAQHYAAFIFTTDGATCNGVVLNSTNIYCLTNSGGATPTVINSGVTITAAVGKYYDIRENSSNNTWTFYINGIQVCQSTTTLPTTNLRQMTLVTTLTTAVETLNFSHSHVWADK